MQHSLIIGASSGIGAALAQQLLAKGHVIHGTYCKASPADLSPLVQWHRYDSLSDELLTDLPEHIDYLAYCPGSIKLGALHRTDLDEYRYQFNLHALGAVKVLKTAYPRLKASHAPSVVLFSTVAVGTGMPMHTSVSMVKAAVEGLTRSVAAEWAPSIRVNCVAPSLTDTPLASALLSTPEKREAMAARNPLRRIGTADEVARVAAHLLTEADWVTGQVWAVDGGMGTLRV